MRRVGILAEFNPFHNGHKALIDLARRQGTVVCVMSGNFVQRGDIAIADKRLRARAALSEGVDLLLELPVPYAMSTAQNFALGGVTALQVAGCDAIMFGSECGDVSLLSKATDRLCTDSFREKLACGLSKGLSFAAARDQAAELGNLLKGANDNLGVEYMLAARRLGADFTFFAEKRLGCGHDAKEPHAGYASGTLLRKKLLTGNRAFCADFMPAHMLELLPDRELADIKRMERAIVAVLRQRTLEELKRLPDVSEGIDNKLFSAIRLATGLEELYNSIKTKRYSLSRIRRLVLSAFLGIDDRFFLQPPPYIRVLGMNKKGEQIVRERAKSSTIPLVLRTAEMVDLPVDARLLFEWETRASDLFSLGLITPKPCGEEYRAKIIKTE